LFDPYQVYKARAAGADAVLLIVAMLGDEELYALHALAGELGMTALVEVHDEAELARALALRPRLVGINNRDLRTFEVDIETTLRLRPLVPGTVALVSESGIHTHDDAARLAGAGVDAMLVGESLVVAEDTAAKVRQLTRLAPRVKICGVTRLDDVLAAVEAGADLVGFNFYPQSKRYLAPADCARLVAAARERNPFVTTVGVFVNSPLEEITSVLDDLGLDMAQLHGDEPPGYLDALEGRAFKAIRPPDLAAARTDTQRYARHACVPALLVDAYRPGEYGGTGQTGDWTLARTLAADHALLLAGGLDAGNVASAMAQVRPWGVDVASGVESSPGRKDHQKMAAFVDAVHNAYQEITHDKSVVKHQSEI
jgi:phosphoribosylanthranilate isomerase